MASESTFDFIVGGAGTAGCVIASRLAKTSSAPRVLILEAGEENDGLANMAPGQRGTFWCSDAADKLNYRYKSVPEAELGGREIQIDRGRGLGGSTAINILGWDYSSREEMDEWARQVGDETWSWAKTKEVFKQVETLHDDTPAEFHKYIYSEPGSRGTGGPVHVSLPSTWAPGLELLLSAAKEYGIPMLRDVSSGDLGLGVLSMTSYNGLRVTANSAYLSHVPPNLIIKTESPVARILFDGKKAIGVELTSGTQYFATRETIISAGAIDSPKILLLSRIGPQDELASHSIPVTSVLPGVGNNFKDKCMVYLKAHLQPSTVPSISMSDVARWQQQWEEDRTGPMGVEPCRIATGYFKLDNLETFAEFQQLDEQAKQLLMRPRTPAYEIAPGIFADPTTGGSFFGTPVILMHPQSTGKISLRSSDPTAAPVIQLNYLQNPYDRRVLVESTKKVIDFIYNSKIPAVEPIVGLTGKTDEEILQFVRNYVSTAWHPQGTVKMGKLDDDTACVGSDFRVIGIENLRVADLSVVPVTLSNHTQASAYVIGEIAAQKLISAYGL
ncbi:GMC oxidoreductase [Trichoderma sp. SZMC 28011]